MEVLCQWSLPLDVDRVLRGEGADPQIIRRRHPRLVAIAERALEEGLPLLEPAVLQRRLAVENLTHERLRLEGGARLSGPLIAQHMGGASQVVVMLCTIGPRLEERVAELMDEDMAYAVALDGLGSAAVEALANEATVAVEAEAAAQGLKTTIPLSPGMMGWPVEVGQPQIMALLEPQRVGVRLTGSGMMVPRKSLTLVLGVGEQVSLQGRACDYCSLRQTCRYQDHYAPH